MRRNTSSIWTNSLFSIIFSAALGIIFIFLFSVLFSAVTFFVLEDIKFLKYFSPFILAAGIYISAFICGKHRRRRGMLEGMLLGFIMFIIISLVGLLFDNMPDIKKLLLLLFFGAAGGVSGVNSKRPENLRD